MSRKSCPILYSKLLKGGLPGHKVAKYLNLTAENSQENFTSCQGWEYRRGRGGVSQQGQVEVSGWQGQVRQVRQQAVCEPTQTKGKGQIQ